MDEPKKRRPTLKEIFTDKRLALMLGLGFSAGLPLLLVFSTQSAWLRTAGIDRAPLFDNPKYPNIIADYQATFTKLRKLPCDVWFYPRATTLRLQEKEERLKKGEKPNPFVDPKGCQWYIDEYEYEFTDQLAQQLRASLQSQQGIVGPHLKPHGEVDRRQARQALGIDAQRIVPRIAAEGA